MALSSRLFGRVGLSRRMGGVPVFCARLRPHASGWCHPVSGDHVRACHPGTVQAFLWMNKQMLSPPDKPWPAPVLRPPTPSPNPAPTAPRASPLAASSSSFRGSSSSDGGSNGNATSSNTGAEALSQLQLHEAEELGEGVTGVVLGGRCVQCVCVVRTPALSAVQCSAVQLGCLLPCWPSFAAQCTQYTTCSVQFLPANAWGCPACPCAHRSWGGHPVAVKRATSEKAAQQLENEALVYSKLQHLQVAVCLQVHVQWLYCSGPGAAWC